MKTMYSLKSYKKSTLLLFVALFGLSFMSYSQVVNHPMSEISTNAKFYTYIYEKTPVLGVEIKYFIIEAPDGTLKVAFDACDVCWANFKGYAQLGSFMRCVNCGNTYPINDLGAPGAGGCWPKYLPHTINGSNIELKESDIESGAPYFQTITLTPDVSGITIKDLPSSYLFKQQSNLLTIEMPTSTERNIMIVGLSGQIIYRTLSSETNLSINTGLFSSGIHILSIEESGNRYNKRIIIQ